MSMQDLPDDELDQLFRKSAEEFERPFNPQAWNAMRQKLDDEDDQVGAIFWRKTSAIAVLLLVVGLGGYYLWESKPTRNISKNQTQNQVIAPNRPPMNQTNHSQKNEITPNQIATKQQNTTKTTSDEQQATTVKQIAQSAANPLNIVQPKDELSHKGSIPRSKKNAKWISSKNKLSVSEKAGSLPQSNSKNLTLERKAESQENVSLTIDKQDAPSRGNQDQYFSEKASEENTYLILLNLHPLLAKRWQLSEFPFAIQTNVSVPVLSPLFIPKKSDPSSFFRKGLGIRTLIAPDLSYITTNQMMKQPTLAVGLVLDYRFSKRWSMQAGGVRTVKLYHATAEQYYWPESWSSQKARPIDIGAECKIIDIPINLRYDLSQGAKSRWFVNSGISSYIMLKEKYDYTYAPHTYNIKWKTWEGTTGNYWLGVLNVSAGFERQLTRDWSLQVEPYLKVPLAQIGMGKVMLNTSGIYLSARYRLGRF